MNSSFGRVDHTWFSPAVIATSKLMADPYKTSDRYNDKILVSDVSGQHIQFIQKRWFPKASDTATLVYIDTKYAHRPDIISVDYYNTPLYAWAILAANSLRSIWQLEAGMYVKIPDIADVMRGLN